MGNKVGPQHIGKNTHHILLTDKDSTELGLICVDRRGNRKGQVAVNPYPQMASQIRQGRGKHSDRVPPFEETELGDFSGGLGSLHFDEDKSKYYSGVMADTSKPGRAICAGLPHLTTGISDNDENSWCDSVFWTAFDEGVTDSITTSFVASASYNIASVTLILRSEKETNIPALQGDELKLSLLAENNDVLKTKSLYTEEIELISHKMKFTFSSVQAVTAGTTYKVKISRESYGAAAPEVKVAVDGSDDLIFRTHDDTADFSILPFEYRGGFYVVTQPADRGVSKLYQLGTRALADSNSGDKTYLVDADKDFSSSGYGVGAGDLIKIIAGPGSEEDQPWRVAVAGADNQISVSPDWLVAHTANTEYVVITDKWELVDTLDYYCTDVTITDRVIHFAGGPDDYHHRARFGNDDGTWTFEGDIGTNEEADVFRSDRLLAIRHDGYPSERPVFDLYSSSLQENASDLNTTNAVKKLTTPAFWGPPYFKIGQLANSDAWYGEDFSDNVEIYSDRGWCAIEWDATFTTGQIARQDVNIDMSGAELILFGMKSDSALSANDLQLQIVDADDTTVSLNFPAVYTGDDMHDDFYWYEIALHAVDTAPSHAFIKLDKIVKVHLNVAVDKNAVVKLKIGQDGFILATRNENNERYELGLTERVNNMIEYGGGAGQVGRKPWVGTNKNVYYIEGGQLKPIYLAEIEELEHQRNCELMLVNDVYLYFNLEGKVQRYYAGKLDNIGPDADDGLPLELQGIPCTGATYPGRVYIGRDADRKISTVMFRKAHGWHEIYRGYIGDKIRKIHILARPDTTDRMYISVGPNIIWVPISLDPENDSDYRFNYEFAIETGRIYAGLRDTDKYFHALKLVAENIAAVGPYYPSDGELEVDYRIWEKSNYKTLGTAYTSDTQTVNFSSDNDVSGEYIQLRIRGYTDSSDGTPILVAAVLKSLERLDVNNTFTYTIELKEGKSLDILGQEDSTGISKLEQLETWIDSPLPLTLSSTSAFEDDKLVFIEPGIRQTLYHKVNQKGQELRIATLTLIEVE